jgi:hypothetical protein
MRKNDLDRYTSGIVLDEIGLAEASASMPLKILHPLLEDGVFFEEEEEQKMLKAFNDKMEKNNMKNNQSATPTDTTLSMTNDWHKIGFIGISNWVLDPAKMKRGIFVIRAPPSEDELREIVNSICRNDKAILDALNRMGLIKSISNAYLKLCEKVKSRTREFFGLRDFYALIKMIYWHLKEYGVQALDSKFLKKAIERNFGGLAEIDSATFFMGHFKNDKIKIDSGVKKVIKLTTISIIGSLSKAPNQIKSYELLKSYCNFTTFFVIYSVSVFRFGSICPFFVS